MSSLVKKVRLLFHIAKFLSKNVLQNSTTTGKSRECLFLCPCWYLEFLFLLLVLRKKKSLLSIFIYTFLVTIKVNIFSWLSISCILFTGWILHLLISYSKHNTLCPEFYVARLSERSSNYRVWILFFFEMYSLIPLRSVSNYPFGCMNSYGDIWMHEGCSKHVFLGLMWTFAAMKWPAEVSSVCKHWCGFGDGGGNRLSFST